MYESRQKLKKQKGMLLLLLFLLLLKNQISREAEGPMSWGWDRRARHRGGACSRRSGR